MAEFTPSAELEETVRRAMAVPEPAPAFVDGLAVRLKAQAAMRARRRPWLAGRARWAWAIGFLLIVLLAGLAIGPANIVAAMQRLLGYIPGVGLVDDSTGLRVLAAPVALEREGISVTVEQAVLDSERTVVIFQVDGIPAEAFPHSEEGPYCFGQPQLILPGQPASELAGEGGESSGTEFVTLDPSLGDVGRGWASGYESRDVFPAIPEEVTEAVFFIPCLMDTAPGAAPENWEMTLRFIPAPPDMTIVPVLEITASPDLTPAPGDTEEAGLVLEQVIELGDRYILIGSFQQGEGVPGGIVMGISAWPSITDANGGSLPFEPASDVDLSSSEIGIFPWAYEIPRGFAAPLTIRLDAVDAEFPADLSFELDTGTDPQPGQEWMLNRDIEVAGHNVTLVSAILHEGARKNGYEFTFRSDADVYNVLIEDLEHSPAGGYGGGSLGEFSAGLVYDGQVPSGVLNFHISGIGVRVAGPWTLTWEPPAEGAPATPVSLPEPCFTAEVWEQALESPAPLPGGLGGRLIAYGAIVGDGEALSPSNAGIFVIDLATGERQVLGPGTWPALSPDGSRAVYSGQDALHVVDLGTGEDRPLPGTTPADFRPRWSPDGSRIAYVHGDDRNLYIVEIDGSLPQRVTEDPQYELLVDWSPDGGSLLYGSPGPEGIGLYFFDLATGAVEDVTVFDGKDAWAALSPDGRFLAYLARVGMDYGLHLGLSDGTGMRLIALLEGWSLSDPLWSPDGDWLMLTVTGYEGVEATLTPVLLSPTTCEAFPLEGIDGYVFDWAVP